MVARIFEKECEQKALLDHKTATGQEADAERKRTLQRRRNEGSDFFFDFERAGAPGFRVQMFFANRRVIHITGEAADRQRSRKP